MSIRKTCKSKAFPMSEDDTLTFCVKNSVSNQPFLDLAVPLNDIFQFLPCRVPKSIVSPVFTQNLESRSP